MKNCVLPVRKPCILFISEFCISGSEAFTEQMWATMRQEDYPCDFGLPRHLFPGAMSQCKVGKELRLSKSWSELWFWDWQHGDLNVEIKQTQLARRQNDH